MQLQRVMQVRPGAKLLPVAPLRLVILKSQGRRDFRPWSCAKALKMTIRTGIYRGLAEVRKRKRRVEATLAGYGVFDLKHFRLLTNPNLPIWLAVLLIGFGFVAEALGTWCVEKAPAKVRAFGFRLLAAQSL